MNKLIIWFKCFTKGHKWFVPIQGEPLDTEKFKTLVECYRCGKIDFKEDIKTWKQESY